MVFDSGNGELKMLDNASADKSFKFTVRIVHVYQFMCGEKRKCFFQAAIAR